MYYLDRFVHWLFADRILCYVAWSRYEIGKTGFGPTSFDQPPPFPKPWLPSYIRRRIDKESKALRKVLQLLFQDAFYEITGDRIDGA